MALDPKKKQDTPHGYEAGKAFGDAARAAAGMVARPQLAAELTGVPKAIRGAFDTGANFASGLTGQPIPSAQTPTPQVNVISPTRPDFGSVRPAAPPADFANVQSGVRLPTPTKPAAAPVAAPGPVAQDAAGAAAGSGGTADPGRVLGTFAGKNGTRTVTAGDAATLAGRLPTAAGAVVTGPNNSFAASTDAMPSPIDTGSVPTLQRPTFGGGAQGAVIGMPGTGPEAERAALLSALNERLRAIGTPNTRGKRDLVANVLKLQTDLTAQGGDLSTRRDLAQLEASTRTNVAQMGETGANYRAELGDAGATQRTMIGERGSNARAELSQAGENYRLLNRPEYAAGADGSYNLVQGGIARPITGPDGQPFKAAGKEGGGLTATNVIDAYDKARQAVIDGTPMGQPADFTTLDNSPVGQRYKALFQGGGEVAASGPPAAAIAHLRANPALAAAFDAKYGQGAAARHLR